MRIVEIENKRRLTSGAMDLWRPVLWTVIVLAVAQYDRPLDVSNCQIASQLQFAVVKQPEMLRFEGQDCISRLVWDLPVGPCAVRIDGRRSWTGRENCQVERSVPGILRIEGRIASDPSDGHQEVGILVGGVFYGNSG